MKSSDVFPSKWLSAADLGDKEPTVTIDRVLMEEISKGERKPVIYFRGATKGLVCNKTNWNRIAYITKAEDSDEWGGKTVTLYVELVDMQGQMKPAIRVKPPKAQNGGAKHVVEERQGYSLSTMKPAERVPGDANTRPDLDDPIPF